MALSVKLQTRQTQNLALTPQLVQSIKLLQMSSTELQQHIGEEVEKNPLLELDEGYSQVEADSTGAEAPASREHAGEERRLSDRSGDVSKELDTSRTALENKLGTTLENEFDGDRSGGEPRPQQLGASGGTDFSVPAAGEHDIGEYVAGRKSLREHLGEQLALSRAVPAVRMAAAQIIDVLDEDGFLRKPLAEIVRETGAEPSEAEEALTLVQSFDPCGVAARDLPECLAIQLREKNHLDPAMACLLEDLTLLAKRDFEELQRRCGVSFDDLMDMVDEIKALDPRPARAFDTAPVLNIVPDVTVQEKPDGSFAIELNPDAMPRVLVNQTYSAIVSRDDQGKEEKAFLTDCLQNANWLVRSLEQRAQTILKVMTEIVRQQDGFFAYGVSHLKPMSLKQVADAIDMHESTVSRVTTNKYVETRRGTYELKYFFTAAIGSTRAGEAHSAESVRQRIRALIENESASNVLSDDAIVEMLKTEGVDIARRTVAKYRESLHLPSSVQRRREKKALAKRR
ncbi:RNA polymerase factor sigma-54 [Salaquimonas pukyongi]|uniref:RNA polymerase factor sigma-54 n=1 Tax=Salaquimonas pukyongi TaxID=2712698 RepID=UPI00096BCFA2|nr:RNA polymerase factor sigma-54 [Salaquimonas pukyongi]